MTIIKTFTGRVLNFEEDQQDAMTKTEHIQSLADQVERLEGLQRIEKVKQSKRFEKRISTYIR